MPKTPKKPNNLIDQAAPVWQLARALLSVQCTIVTPALLCCETVPSTIHRVATQNRDRD